MHEVSHGNPLHDAGRSQSLFPHSAEVRAVERGSRERAVFSCSPRAALGSNYRSAPAPCSCCRNAASILSTCTRPSKSFLRSQALPWPS